MEDSDACEDADGPCLPLIDSETIIEDFTILDLPWIYEEVCETVSDQETTMTGASQLPEAAAMEDDGAYEDRGRSYILLTDSFTIIEDISDPCIYEEEVFD